MLEIHWTYIFENSFKLHSANISTIMNHDVKPIYVKNIDMDSDIAAT